MGWGCADGQAANVRRGMNACRAELAARPGLRAQWLRRFGSAPLFKSSKSSEPVTPQLQASTPACAALAANEKRLNAVLAQQVDWELPPLSQLCRLLPFSRTSVVVSRGQAQHRRAMAPPLPGCLAQTTQAQIH